MATNPASTRRAAFTLIELMVVIAITSILVGLSAAGLARARLAATRAACLANLRTFGHTIQLYRDANHDLLPLATKEPDVRFDRYAPFDALGLETPLPSQGEDRAARSSPPFRCRADREIAPVTGFSYVYTPTDLMRLMAVHPQREVTSYLSRDSMVILMLDDRPFHAPRAGPGGQNVLLMDGSARARTADLSLSPRF